MLYFQSCVFLRENRDGIKKIAKYLPGNRLQEIAADFLISTPKSSETSQWAVTPKKLLFCWHPHRLSAAKSFFKLSLNSQNFFAINFFKDFTQNTSTLESISFRRLIKGILSTVLRGRADCFQHLAGLQAGLLILYCGKTFNN